MSAVTARPLVGCVVWSLILTYSLGLRNAAADALYCMSIYDVHPFINYDELAREQQRDYATSDYESSITSLKWDKIQIKNNSVLCDISTGMFRP